MKKNISREISTVSNYDTQVDIARDIFLNYDQNKLITKFDLQKDDEYIYITYINTQCRIHRKTARIDEYVNSVWNECRSYNSVMTIYDLLCHSQGNTCPELWGKWCTVNKFSMLGSPESGFFTKKYAELFDNRISDLQRACQRIGGEIKTPIAGADLSCMIKITPFFYVILQFWNSDDEFPAQLKLLWDENSMEFLHFETTFFLQGDILERIARFSEE